MTDASDGAERSKLRTLARLALADALQRFIEAARAVPWSIEWTNERALEVWSAACHDAGTQAHDILDLAKAGYGVDADLAQATIDLTREGRL